MVTLPGYLQPAWKASCIPSLVVSSADNNHGAALRRGKVLALVFQVHMRPRTGFEVPGSGSAIASHVPFPSFGNSIGTSKPTLLAVKRTLSSSFMFMPGLYRSSSVMYSLCAFR